MTCTLNLHCQADYSPATCSARRPTRPGCLQVAVTFKAPWPSTVNFLPATDFTVIDTANGWVRVAPPVREADDVSTGTEDCKVEDEVNY